MSEVSAWFCCPGCDCPRCNALREVPRLAVENERLCGEVEIAYKSRDEAVERANRLEFGTPDEHWKSLALAQGKTITEQERLIAHMQENLDECHTRIAALLKEKK